ncbi:N-acyl homoserine lactonase family protein [Paracraurococcus ruber]|uniref:MBL fold hydrolase n=1 Tax=Paracraurococcus ruber TaxID=77675 RepID=A0ABS1D093_9PROT|nr:N-acyl homoserine lactonase family protein [Paracraurococcus ruber]MBK1660224.1 MBL fold hydrolase [Paracraurococcus ruber]TDG29679.1 N-acyl homoserine lactonase family protein [Paracraurococcus ruber]
MAWQVFALRYAMRAARRQEHFIGGDPHDAPMPMDYFVWAMVRDGRAWVLDTGFTAEVAARRKREYLRCPIESLSLLGIAPEAVEEAVISHLHYDHVGSFHKFPRARFHLQEAEMRYATGRYMCHHRLRHSFEFEDVAGIVRMTFADRVVFHDGDAELAPGLRIHACGGHSAGLQCVTVETARGTVVLASDVAHFYENLEAKRPFTTAFHVGDMLEGFDRLRALAPTPRHIVPGHDPEVMRRYPAVPGLEGIAVRLDLDPKE